MDLSLPASEPSGTDSIEEPVYATYAGLTPHQRWNYLTWLGDTSARIGIGYVFLYYHALERRLMSGDFEAAFREINKLREVHTHCSFASRSGQALLAACIYLDNLEAIRRISRQVESLAPDVDLTIAYLANHSLEPSEIMALRSCFMGLDRYYRWKHLDMLCPQISQVLVDHFGEPTFPIWRLYCQNSIEPLTPYWQFDRTFWPATKVKLPNVFNHPAFITDITNILNKAMARVHDANRQKSIAAKDDNRLALITAARFNSEESLSRLLASGANVDSTDQHSKTALIWAADNGHETLVQILIKHGANVNLRDRYKQSALLSAIKNGTLQFHRIPTYARIVDALLSNGADFHQVDKSGMTALQVARKVFFQDAIELLLQAGAGE